jgi:hypothetical protein
VALGPLVVDEIPVGLVAELLRLDQLMKAAAIAELTRQRAITYWDCYYRYQHSSPDAYPVPAALPILSGGRTT